MREEATAISNKGVQVPSMKRSYEIGIRDAALQLSCSGDMPSSKHPVNLFDLLQALQVHKSAIASHTVYATNIERILTKLWHPSNEEIQQDMVHKEEQRIKSNIQNQQTLLHSC